MFTALYDACVLYPAPLRDLLMRLALTGLFQAKWTEQIHGEWTRSVLANRPDLRPEQLDRTRQLMNAYVPDSLVTGYEGLIASLELPDVDDRHVLAAAIVGHADIIVTFNLSDFPKKKLEPYGIEAWHPDEFVCYLLDLNEAVVCMAVKHQREALRNPPKTAEELLELLQLQSLPLSVARLKQFRSLL